LHFSVAQDLEGKALAVAIEGRADATDIANIGAYAVNLTHDLRQSK
jgi:hypothetical protein